MKVITNFRYYILVLVATATIIGVFSAPSEDLPLLTWLWALVSSKAVGFGAGYLFYYLTDRGEKRGSIPELTQFIKEL